jgi:hypothetical protein
MGINVSPLDELNETALYAMLGEDWYARFKPNIGHINYLTPSSKIGMDEFATLAQLLRADLKNPYQHGLFDCVAQTVRRSGTWPMPVPVVAALAVKLGFGVHDAQHQAP